MRWKFSQAAFPYKDLDYFVRDKISLLGNA